MEKYNGEKINENGESAGSEMKFFDMMSPKNLKPLNKLQNKNKTIKNSLNNGEIETDTAHQF